MLSIIVHFVHCRPLSSIVVYCYQLLSTVVHCGPLWSIFFLFNCCPWCPLLSIIVHCRPLVSIVVHCCTTQPRSAMIYILHHKLPSDDTLSKPHIHLYILNFMALVLMVHFWYWWYWHEFWWYWRYWQHYHWCLWYWHNPITFSLDSEVICNPKKSTNWLTDLLNNFDLRDASASKMPEL